MKDDKFHWTPDAADFFKAVTAPTKSTPSPRLVFADPVFLLRRIAYGGRLPDDDHVALARAAHAQAGHWGDELMRHIESRNWILKESQAAKPAPPSPARTASP